jgi:hypothetical protein
MAPNNMMINEQRIGKGLLQECGHSLTEVTHQCEAEAQKGQSFENKDTAVFAEMEIGLHSHMTLYVSIKFLFTRRITMKLLTKTYWFIYSTAINYE